MKLILIYNARSGKINGLISSFHKLVSPSTYKCNLCHLTHGLFEERQKWKDFMSESNFEFEFFHLDEINHLDVNLNEFPAIYLEINGKLELLLSAPEIDKIVTIEEFILKLKKSNC